MERDSDEHEEGEIIDDFEDISDYSIPSTSYSGKSVSHRDLLQDVSLSSISDSETDDLIYIDTYSAPRSRHAKRRSRSVHCRRRKRHRSHEYYPRHTLNKYISPLSESSDTNDFEVDPKMQKQLKDAIRIETSHIHHNSLRTRLKAMLQNDNIHTKTEDEEEETLRTLALLSNSKDEVTEETLDKKSDDQESADDKDEELIELRLAALKSAVLRKAPEIRKRKFKQHPKKDVDQGQETNKENNANQENNINEDDVKKAELQDKQDASQGEIQNETSRNTSMEEDIDIMRAKLLASMSKKIAASLPKQNAIAMIPREISVKPILNEKLKLSKQQIKVKPLIINLNDSDSDTDVTIKKDQENVDKDIHLVNSVHEFLKKQRAAVEAKSKSESGKTTALDKSVVKLLSKSQQKEYHLLKQKLLLAKRKRLRKSSQKIENNNGVVNKPTECNSKDISVVQASVPKPNGLQKTLDDMQIKKDGRLQMKGKYKALELLLQKVKQASATRKQNELEIKVLLEKLQKVRDKLAISHKNYTNLVLRLMNEKNAIDRRINKMHNNDIVNAIKSTSTPVKSDVQESICDISSIQVSTSDDVKELKANNGNIKIEHENGLLSHPNDIEEIPKCNGGNALKQYVSPLDSKHRDIVEDPLMTFCPYDLFGVCKDPECKFNHCSKT